MAKKKLISEEQAQENAKLKDFFNKKKNELGLNQELLAEKLNIGQSAVSHYLNGTNALNPVIAAQFAQILNIHIDDFSPRLAEEIRIMAGSLRPSVSLNIADSVENNGQGSSQLHIGDNDFSNQNNNYGNGDYYHINNYDDNDCESKQQIAKYEHLLIKPMPILDIAEAIHYAGYPEEERKQIKPKEKAATFIHHSQHTFAVRMPDDTMANPDYAAKSIYQDELVIFDPSVLPARGGDIVLASVNNQAVIARLETDLTGSQYLRRFTETEKQPLNENIRIFAVAIEVKSRFYSNEALAARKV